MLKNPFNYSGSKNRILPLIEENLPKDCNQLVDLFGGSGEISLNLVDRFDQVYYNEKNRYIYGMLRTFSMHSKEFCLKRIQDNIDFYSLNKDNKSGFLQFRKDFNYLGSQILLSDNFNGFTEQAYIDLYTLIVHSFNYFCTIDKNGKYINTSGAGRSWFNPSLKNKLVKYIEALHQNYGKILMYNLDFEDMYTLISEQFNDNFSNVFMFVDPPYTISDDTYSRSNGLEWTEEQQFKLHDLLDDFSNRGGKFMYTNLYKKGENTNTELLNFSKKYKNIITNEEFYRCSYQRKKVNDTEILIKNY